LTAAGRRPTGSAEKGSAVATIDHHFGLKINVENLSDKSTHVCNPSSNVTAKYVTEYRVYYTHYRYQIIAVTICVLTLPPAFVRFNK